jgi:hypothetical protein
VQHVLRASFSPTSGAPNSARPATAPPAPAARTPQIADDAGDLRADELRHAVDEGLERSAVVGALAAGGSAAASAGAVIAGCLVATVQCSSITMTKLMA